MGQDHAGKGGGQHQHQQPGDPVAGVLEHAGGKIAVLTGLHSGHALEVLGGLFDQNVGGVVNRYDTDQHSLAVHHRHGDKAVPVQFIGHFLFVVGDLHADDVVVHQLFHGLVRTGQQQVPGADHAQQLVALGHIQGIDRFGVFPLPPDHVQRLGHGHILAQPDILRRHDAAGGIGRVVQQPVQAVPGLFAGLRQHPLDHAGGHLFQNIRRVVQGHFFQRGGQLRVAEFFNQFAAGLLTQPSKNFRRHVLFHQTEQQQPLLHVHLFHGLGQVGGLHIFGQFPQFAVFLCFQQLLQLLNQFFNFHRAYLLTQDSVQVAPGFRQPAVNAGGHCRTPARLLRGLPLGSMQFSTCLFVRIPGTPAWGRVLF